MAHASIETKALRHLELCEREYAAIGTPGVFVREHVLRPLRDAWNRGDRSPKLILAQTIAPYLEKGYRELSRSARRNIEHVEFCGIFAHLGGPKAGHHDVALPPTFTSVLVLYRSKI